MSLVTCRVCVVTLSDGVGVGVGVGVAVHHRHWSNRSAVWYEMQEYERALQDAEMCRRLKPEWPKAYYRCGQALMALHNYIDAATVLYSGLQYAPKGDDTLETMFQRAVALGRKQHRAQAAAAGGSA